MRVAIYGSYPDPRLKPDWTPQGTIEDFKDTCYALGRYFAKRRDSVVVTSADDTTADCHILRGFIDEWMTCGDLPKADERCILVLAPTTRQAFERHVEKNPGLFLCKEAADRTRFDRHLVGLSECDCVVAIGGADHTSNAIGVAQLSCKPVYPIGTFGAAARKALVPLMLRNPILNPLLAMTAVDVGRMSSLMSLANDGKRGRRRVFIGHGHSTTWRELSEFLSSRLKLDHDEFNREATAGWSTKERLQAMLDDAAFAFLVLTAEDSRADGTKTARANVIHEVGLFQGRLGFEKAIVLLEEGCDEFSNIAGITALRFPPNNVKATFEEVRRVLEREGIVKVEAAQAR
jgi:hypothetical protein